MRQGLSYTLVALAVLSTNGAHAQWPSSGAGESTAQAVRRLDMELRGGPSATQRRNRRRRTSSATPTTSLTSTSSPSLRAMEGQTMALGATCDGHPTGIAMTTPNGPLAQDDVAILEAEGCFEPATTFQWLVPSSATIVGAGPRVNLLTGMETSMTVEVCAVASETHCHKLDVSLGAQRPRVELHTMVELADYGYGKVWRLEGTTHAMPAGATLKLFKHSDVHYLENAVPVFGPGGSFAFEAFALSSVDRFVVEMMDDVAINSYPGCASKWCRGSLHDESGHHVPIPPDGASIYAFATAYVDQPGDHPNPSIDAAIDLLGDALPGNGGRLLHTSWESDLCFLYEQAVAVIAFGAAGARTEAEGILDALAGLQLADGSWYFAYYDDGTSPFPQSGDVRYSGAVAWAALAFASHRHLFGTTQYDSVLNSVIAYLNGTRATFGGSTGLLFNPTDLSNTSWDETQVMALEHNADALAAVQVLGDPANDALRADLEQTVLARWNGQYFRPGVHEVYGENYVELYLDPQTWGLLALDGTQALAHLGALDFACERFTEPAGMSGREAGIFGMFDFDLTNQPLPHGRFVWTEGTHGAALALERARALTGQPIQCAGQTPTTMRAELGRLAAFGLAGVPDESTQAPDSPYRPVPTAASVLWHYLSLEGVNPFERP